MCIADNDQLETRFGPRLVELALVFLIFLAQGGLRVPELNEPNYLAKAKHYWNPEWCSGDLFLESDDAHRVFYTMFGWMAQWFSLASVAQFGRLVTYLLLAVAWQRLSRAVVPEKWFAVLTAALFLAFSIHAHMAGEWVVGSFESKGIAYALVLFALADVVSNRWRRAWILFGAASAFHVIVGGWSVLAAGVCWLSMRRDKQTPSLGSMLPALAIGLLLAMPGLWPAIQLNRGAEASLIDEANRILVFERLQHHLWAPHFLTRWGHGGQGSGPRNLLLLGLFVALCYAVRGDVRLRRLRGFVGGAVTFAVIGLLITLATLGSETWAARLLRFYWYRLSDVMLPVGTALSLACLILRGREVAPKLARAWLVAAIAVSTAHLGGEVWKHQRQKIPAADHKFLHHKDPERTRQRYADWLELCRNVATSAEIPSDAVFLTPRTSHTFKWYAQKPEVALWKEVPQDAASVVEWWTRLQTIYGSGANRRKSLTQLSAAELTELADELGFDYVVTRAEPPIEGLDPIFHNDSFALYDVSPQ